MLPLYAARIEDLGQGDFVKVDCAGCDHIALLTPEALLRAGLRPTAKVLDLKGRLRCRGCGEGASGSFDPEREGSTQSGHTQQSSAPVKRLV